MMMIMIRAVIIEVITTGKTFRTNITESCFGLNSFNRSYLISCINPLKDEAQTALFKDPVRTAL